MITARHYDKAADILAGAHAVRMRLMKPKNAVKQILAIAAPVIDLDETPRPVLIDGPQWMREPTYFNDHIHCWEWQLANRGGDRRQYIVQRCKDIELKYSDFMGPSRKFDMTGKRQLIWYELRCKFNLSYPQIGSMCGDRDHTTIMSGIKRVARIMNLDIPESISDQSRLMDDRELNDCMRREYAKGMTQAQLAKKFRLAEGAIQKVAQLEKWPRESLDVAKKYDLAGIFDAYYGGLPIKEITSRFSIPQRTLQGLRQRFGWKKRDTMAARIDAEMMKP